MSANQRRELLSLARSLPAADISVLAAALETLGEERPTLLTSTAGSGNDGLWAGMVGLGWLAAEAPLEGVPESRVYRVLPHAREPLREFLAETTRAEAMTALINEMRATVPPMLIDAVREVDGTPADLAILVAGIVEATMRQALKPHLYDEFLREVARVAEGLRAS